MRSYIELIQAWEDFLQQQPTGSLQEFGEWLLQQRPSESLLPSVLDKQTEEYVHTQQSAFGYSAANARSPALIWKLNKILKQYTKSLFDAVDLRNHDEFAILTQVHQRKECSKKQAIEANLIDRSTGIDMIKRMIKRGILKDRVDPNDGRSRLIRLSEKGEALLYQLYTGFATIPELLVNMTEAEQQQFVATLQRLEQWHSSRL